MYEDETQNNHLVPQVAEELEPMSEVGDHYLEAVILLPSWNKIACSHIVAQSHDANQNPMGRAHTNTILDTRMYQVEFAGDEVTELTSNIIAESMCAQCDADGNVYLLLDNLFDYSSDNRAIYLTEQQIN